MHVLSGDSNAAMAERNSAVAVVGTRYLLDKLFAHTKDRFGFIDVLFVNVGFAKGRRRVPSVREQRLEIERTGAKHMIAESVSRRVKHVLIQR